MFVFQGEESMEPWTFVQVADIHVGSPRSFRFALAWNENWQTARKQIVEINPDLLLVGGDMTRDGYLHTYEMENIKADLDSLPFPSHAIPGNMETGNKHTEVTGPLEDRNDVSLNLQSEQLDRYSAVFGPTQWSFVHKEIRFSGFCDMIAGSGLPEEKGFWEWMESQRDEPRAKHHIWLMHYPLFLDDLHELNFDIRDLEQYNDWYFGIDEPARSHIMEVFKATGTDIVISGHIQCRKVHYAEGIRFDIAPSTSVSQMDDRWVDGDPTLGFMRYDVIEDGIKPAFVPLEKVSTAKGYGPRGHPGPNQRDYSLAWEK